MCQDKDHLYIEWCNCTKIQGGTDSSLATGTILLECGWIEDKGLEKLNPLTMRIYDEKRQKVDMRFLDMCTTIGKHAATAEAIFEKMNAILSAHAIAWEYCVKIGVDNTSVNIGRHNSILTRVHKIAANAYFISCQCHIAHNTANTAADAFGSTTSFDVKDLVVDMFYRFNHHHHHQACCTCYVSNHIRYS